MYSIVPARMLSSEFRFQACAPATQATAVSSGMPERWPEGEISFRQKNHQHANNCLRKHLSEIQYILRRMLSEQEKRKEAKQYGHDCHYRNKKRSFHSVSSPSLRSNDSASVISSIAGIRKFSRPNTARLRSVHHNPVSAGT